MCSSPQIIYELRSNGFQSVRGSCARYHLAGPVSFACTFEIDSFLGEGCQGRIQNDQRQGGDDFLREMRFILVCVEKGDAAGEAHSCQFRETGSQK